MELIISPVWSLGKKPTCATRCSFDFKKEPSSAYRVIRLPRYIARYTIAEEDSYGLIAGQVNPATVGSRRDEFIVELLDEKYQVVRTAYRTHRLIVSVDLNRDCTAFD